MNYQLLQGDNRAVLRTLPDQSVHCIVTSPPYYGLRDYGTAEWDGGDPACDHKKISDVMAAVATSTLGGGKKTTGHQQEGFKETCGKCGATRIDQQIGLEATPEQYVAELVNVFRECWRVLRDDGTLWLNLGDSYNGSGGPGSWADNKQTQGFKGEFKTYSNPNRKVYGLKPKDLIGIPWLVAFALRADGWYLRSDIIWHKPNPMPESVTDRPTKAHEYIFLLTKSQRYYYDAEAVREPLAESTVADKRNGTGRHTQGKNYSKYFDDGSPEKSAPDMPSWYRGKTFVNPESGRNRRSVWTVATAPYSGAHFATFPPALIEPCILASTSEYGCCAQCGAPWERVVERGNRVTIPRLTEGNEGISTKMNGPAGWNSYHTTGWQATCTCAADVIPCTVCDPFNGSGTTVAVAVANGRTGIGIDLSADYIELAHERIREAINDSGRAYIAPVCKTTDFVDLPLFGG